MNTKLAFRTCALLSASLLSPSAPAESLELNIAPVNPRLTEALMQRNARFAESATTEEGCILGYLPSPVVLPRSRPRVGVARNSLPSRFDLRELHVLPPIRDQGRCGSYWAFATLGPLESFRLYVRNKGSDLSEQDLNQRHGFYAQECEGGTHFMSMAFLASWSGPVDESAVPYPVPVEARLSNYSSAANSYEGQSFVGADGRAWLELASATDVSPLNPLTELPFANVALKAFGRAAPAP